EKLLVEYSFDSNRKRMSVIYHNSSGLTSYIKGAPEELLKDSIYIKEGKNIREISKKDREYFTEMIQTMGQDALRVIGVAFKTFNYNQVSPTLEESEKNVIFVGLLGIIDPPREEVKEAIKLAKQAGIRPVMLTGDHVITAKAIATQVGILEHDHQNLVLVGDYINELSEEELDRIVEDIRVCARVSPEHKTRIAQALKKKGHIVAMTGDGVNDAPALKTADIGIAMGIKGTDVTKEAADMILEDDNFTTIVKAVEGGRRIYSNITKYVRLMLCANFDEFLLIFVTSSLGLPVPFLPIHVLWINLVTDGLPAIALGNDPGETGLMEQKPRNPKEGLLDRYWGFIGFSAVLAFLADFIPYYLVYYWTGDIAVARSVCVTSIVLFELVLAYQVRSETKHLFKQGLSAFTNNPGLLLAVISSFILQVGVLTFPPLQGIMKMAPMKIEYFILCVIASLSALIIVPGWLIPKTKDWTLSSK
ncbi:cation-transporting P-type ATPase, partial [Candidatus Bathyarchaeota archaeon]|nr:cation-transporting P-type ATPase [Candidatus Bathyarchaeota archaeon]